MTDQARLTLPLGIRRSDGLHPQVRARIAGNLAANALRHQRALEVHGEWIDRLKRHGIPFVFLKGLTHAPYFCHDPRYRQQYDIDIYSPPGYTRNLLAVAIALGYEPVNRGRETPTDHLPVMIRKTGWRWRGDYYDPEMPLHLEIHFQLWDREVERFDVAGTDEMWQRREPRLVSGIELPAFHLRDTFRYAAIHILRHLLRGSLCPGHLYEFAHFLHTSACDDLFWSSWRRASLSECLAEVLASNLALHCFGCSLNCAIQDLIAQLPPNLQKWFDLFALSPLLNFETPNKDELLLHLQLVSRPHMVPIAKRRLLPSFPSRFSRNPHTDQSGAFADHLALLARRAVYHLRSVGTLARSGARWLWEAGDRVEDTVASKNCSRASQMSCWKRGS